MLDMLLDLPVDVRISDERVIKITNNADWKTMLKCSHALADETTEHDIKVMGVLTMFYEEITIDNIEQYAPFLQELIMSMYFVLSYGNLQTEETTKKPTVNFAKDIKLILEGIAINHGEIRTQNLHWWTFRDYFNGIKDSTFNVVAGIRYKQSNGKKLEKWEQEFLKNNREMVRIE